MTASAQVAALNKCHYRPDLGSGDTAAVLLTPDLNGMSGYLRQLTTDEQRAWLYEARRRGGLCALCGRALAEGEPVYVDRVVVGRCW